MSTIPLQFAQNITSQVDAAWQDGSFIDAVSPTTRTLLAYWFGAEYTDLRTINFHEGQRQAILNTIYLHEVIRSENTLQSYQTFCPDLLLEDRKLALTLEKEKHAHAKYCIKMATGTGKTWVLMALIIWQYLNRKYEQHGYFTKNFLIVAPGLIVYERLLHAFLGEEQEETRDFSTSDIYKIQELFLPEQHRQETFSFFQSCVVKKEEIGQKITGEGMIAITNWHLLVGSEETVIDSSSDYLSPHRLLKSIPLPGKAKGNDLSILDGTNTYDTLQFLRYMSDLFVFNDEAHHIHEVQRKGKVQEVEWQKSLRYIAETKLSRFTQIDFSATPYNQYGNEKVYFPHIIVDFDLKTAIRQGLVKTLVLDQRKELAALELDYKAERNEDGTVIAISEGQRIMLRAGLEKLQILGNSFAEISLGNPKTPKMLVICEDTAVVPFVHEFLKGEGLVEEEILEIHSSKKGEVGPEEWQSIKRQLFSLDQHQNPKVIISVLMLREGFDVNNICVIVPLRSSQSLILLEQTIGRGLRLMWREPEFTDEKDRNRKKLLEEKTTPDSYFDLLSIVEHPAFVKFYDELIKDGIVGVDTRNIGTAQTVGNIKTIGLRDGYQQYDFHFPVIIQEAEEILKQPDILPEQLTPFPIPLREVKKLVSTDEVFVSEEITGGVRFGDYRIHGGIMSATGYNDYISRLLHRVSNLLSQPITSKSFNKKSAKYPILQVFLPVLAAISDTYIRHYLFDEIIDPFADNNWKVLLIDKVAEHIIGELSKAILLMQQTEHATSAEVHTYAFSQIQHIRIREDCSVQTAKSIYPQTGFPSHKGGFEKAFIEFADRCTSIHSHVKIFPHIHHFVRLRYVRSDGLSAFYYPDFLLRSQDDQIYLVETKGDDQITHPNVERKKSAALYWIEKVNDLSSEQRDHATWHYVLLGQSLFQDWQSKGANMQEILEFQKLFQTPMINKLL